MFGSGPIQGQMHADHLERGCDAVIQRNPFYTIKSVFAQFKVLMIKSN